MAKINDINIDAFLEEIYNSANLQEKQRLDLLDLTATKLKNAYDILAPNQNLIKSSAKIFVVGVNDAFEGLINFNDVGTYIVGYAIAYAKRLELLSQEASEKRKIKTLGDYL